MKLIETQVRSWHLSHTFLASLGFLTGAFYVGLLDGLLGVAGMMTLLVGQWIIPEKSMRLASK